MSETFQGLESVEAESSPSGGRWTIVPWLIAVTLVPLIVYQRVIPLEGVRFENWTGQKSEWDFFTFYKSRWLMALALLGGFLQRARGLPQVPPWFQVPLLGYGVLAVWSTLFSDYPWETLSGSPGRYEGLGVLLAYIWICRSGMRFVGGRWQVVRWLTIGVLAASVIVAMIGVVQSLGFDPYQDPRFRALIFREPYLEMARNPEMIATGAVSAFSTLANSNYSGSYAALLFVFTSGLMYFSRSSRRWWVFPLQLLHFAFLLGSRSKAGLLGGLLGWLGVLWMARRSGARPGKALMALLVAGSLTFLLLDHASMKMGEGSERLLDNFQRNKIFYDAPLPNDFETMTLGSETVDLQFRSFRLKIAWRNGFVFLDEQNQEIPYRTEGKIVRFPDSVALRVKARIAPEQRMVKIERGETVVLFQHTDNGFKILDQRGRTYGLLPVRRWWIDNNDRWGNGRGFIWSRTLPLLSRYLLLGEGADAFLYVFPNHDFIAKLRAGYGVNWFVDKPHNWYLQIAVNTGVLSLVAVSILLVGYLAQSYKLYWRADFTDERVVYGATLAWSVLAYMVTGIFNDSVVGVAPVFWAFLGGGIGMNLVLQRTGQGRTCGQATGAEEDDRRLPSPGDGFVSRHHAAGSHRWPQGEWFTYGCRMRGETMRRSRGKMEETGGRNRDVGRDAGI